jgi:hypothetical protein
MALGPGKYDDECTKAREATMADGCILIVINGSLGSGFSCQLSENLLPLQVAEILDNLSFDIKDAHAISSARNLPHQRRSIEI